MTELRNGRPEISVGPPDDRGRRLVELRHGNDVLHADRFDVVDAFKRKLFGEAAAGKLPAARVATLADAEKWSPHEQPPDIAADIADSLLPLAQQADEEQDDKAGPLVEYHAISSAEFDAAKYEREYIIDGVLVAGEPAIMAGSKKSLKTSLLVDLAVSVASGSAFLGTLQVARVCRVGLMSGESGLGTLQETARRICDSKGLVLRNVGGVVWSADLPRFGDAVHHGALDRFVKDHALEVLAIDPAYLTMPGGDASNLFVQGEMLRDVSEVCQRNGVTLILAHHTRKNIVDPFQPPELEDIAWAGFQEFARQWLLIGRRERYEPGSGLHRLWLNVGGSAGHSALWALDIDEGACSTHSPRCWSVSLATAHDARNAAEELVEQGKARRLTARLDADKRAILNAAAKTPSGETAKVLRATTALSNDRFTAALAVLVEDNDVEPVTITKGNGRQYDGFRLRLERGQE